MEEQINDQELTQDPLQDQPPVYTPRPGWQVWLARIGLVIMLICVALYYWHIACGGKI